MNIDDDAVKTAIDRLNAIDERGDQEEAHILADESLLLFLRANGLSEIADSYDAVKERCGPFYYA